MELSVLIAYGTKRGSTREVAEALGDELARLGFSVTSAPVGEIEDLTPYDAVVVGGALYMGRWHPDAVAFLSRHRVALAQRPLALYAMGPRTTEPKDVSDARKQLDHSVARVTGLHPVDVTIFGGVVDPAKLRFPLNRLPASDARDWEAIRAWAAAVADRFAFGKAATEGVDPRSELQQSPR
jgi:menaquinone-dependent protoporphyrinogen oxidase